MNAQHFRFVVFVVLLAFIVQSANAGKPEGTLKGFAAKRTWSDATGKFKLEGQLEFADSNIAHIKTTAGKLMQIPLAKLSESDRSFVDAFLAAEKASSGAGNTASDSPFSMVEANESATSVPSPQPDATFSEAPTVSSDPKTPPRGSGNASAKNTASSDPKSAFPRRPTIVRTSRPIPLSFDKSYWKSKPPFGLKLNEASDLIVSADITKPFFAGFELRAAGKSPIALVNVHESGHRGNYSSFMVVSLVGGESSPVVRMDTPIKLLAFSPDGARALGINLAAKERNSALVVMKVDASGVTVEYEFLAGGGDWDELTWATFLPNNRVMTITQKHTVSIWDLENGRGVPLHSRGNLGDSLPIITTIGNDQIAVVSKQSIAIVDGSELKQMGCITCDKPILAACFSHDGSKIGLQMAYELAVYSTTDGKLIKSIPIANADKAFVSMYGKYALVGDLLYDIEQGIPFWTYEGASSGYALADLMIRGFAGDNGTTITTTKLPHAAAIDAAESYDANDRYAMVPGTPVRIEVSVKGNFGQKQLIEDGIRENVVKAGWKLDDSADIVVVASLEQGETKKEEYVTSEGRFGIPPPPMFGNASGPVDEVSFTPWTHKVEIKKGDKTLFANVRYVGAPYSFQSKEGESTQATVSRLVQPDPNYYKTLNLPPYIYKPELQQGFGKSKLEASGLQSAK